MADPRDERRHVLRALGVAGCAVLAGAAAGVGCSGDQAGQTARGVRLALSDLPLDRRVVITLSGRPVELRRTEAGVAARSLLCTHFGCQVAWSEAQSVYICPCHDGRFDAEGRAIAGPPRQALPEVPLRVEGDTVVLGEPDPARA